MELVKALCLFFAIVPGFMLIAVCGWYLAKFIIKKLKK